MYKIKAQEVIGCQGLTVVPGTPEEDFYFTVMPSCSHNSSNSMKNIKNQKKVFYLTPRHYPGYSELMTTEAGKKIIGKWEKKQTKKDLETKEYNAEETFIVIR